MIVRRAAEDDRSRMAAFAVSLQERPDRHVGYLGLDADSIAAEMVEEVDDWTEAAVVAEEDGQIIGWLMGSIDHEMGRVWWFGPFVDADEPDRWRAVADDLDQAARDLLPAGVTEEEYGPDAHHATLVEWVQSRGGVVDTGSAVLSLDGPTAPIPGTVGSSGVIEIRPITDDDLSAVAPLHDALFPGTHTTGEVLVTRRDGEHLRLVAEIDGAVVGYVAVERHPDGSGYVDYVGVDPGHRRRGLGARLVDAGVDALRGIGCDRCHLTVRADNDGARALYASLGFTEERVIVPVRVGFSLG